MRAYFELGEFIIPFNEVLFLKEGLNSLGDYHCDIKLKYNDSGYFFVCYDKCQATNYKKWLNIKKQSI